MSDSRADMRRKIDNWFDLHLDEMLEDFRKLIAVKSVRGLPQEGAPYGEGSRAVLALAKTMLEERGYPVCEFEDIMITADMGPSPPQLGILAHLDIVDPGEGWDTDPYVMTIKDNRIYARGTVDNKGPALAGMYAMYCVNDIYPKLKSGFRLILGSGEETGCDDIAQYLSKNEPPPSVFTPDADYPVVNTEKGRAAVFFNAAWEKDIVLPRVVSITGGRTMNVVPNRAEAVIEGMTPDEAEPYCSEYSAKTGAPISPVVDGDKLIVKAEGTAAHAAMLHLGLNAQTALLEMLAAMPFAESKGQDKIRALSRLFPHGDIYGRALGIEMSDAESGKLTVNFGVLDFTETGFTGNIDSRTSVCADKTDLLGMIRDALEREGVRMTHSNVSKSHHTPGDSVFVQTLLRIYEEYTGEPGRCLAIGGQTYVHDIPGGVAFGCEMEGTDNRIHGANEFIGIPQLIISAKMFTQAIVDTCADI